jgi:rRNA maturation RNase YbeY
MSLSIGNHQRKYPVSVLSLKRVARTTLKSLKRLDAEISIVLVNDQRIRKLNRQYRKIDKATDVLAFPIQEGVGHGLHPWFLGDVVLSIQRAAVQAREKGHPLRLEISILLIHGILHLAGYDHERSPAEAARMRRKERAVLELITQKRIPA